MQEKKKLYKRTLDISSYHIGSVKPYTAEIMAESVAKLKELAQRDHERMMLEEARNKVESYIYKIKNKLMDDEEEIAKVTTQEQVADLSKLAEDAEEWMYEDGYDADIATFEDKYAELSPPAEKIFFRMAESTARPEAIKDLRAKLNKVEDLMTKWETTMPQVTDEERMEVLGKVEEVRKWIADKEDAQALLMASEDAAFVSADCPLQTKTLEALVARLNRKPKPKPPKVEKNETEATNETDATEATNETQTGDEATETDEEPASTTGEEETAKADDAGDTSTEEKVGEEL
jgi:hypoxia up-regulated 1